jgi:Dyp-type peroxidase family
MKNDQTEELLKKSISYDSPEFQLIGDKIQGNILKGNGRSHTSHIFFKFKQGCIQEAKDFIKNFSATITTAKKQKEQSEKFKENKVQDFFKVFFLTANGYKFLEFDNIGFKSMKEAEKEAVESSNYDHPNYWDDNFKQEKSEIHGMIMVAYGKDSIVLPANAKPNEGQKERNELNSEVEKIVTSLRNVADFIFIEKGDSIKNANGDDVEHFGYVDGISQPILITNDRNPDTITNWDPIMPLDLVLLQDPLMPNNANAYGSFFVFRKLEQNVQGFKQAEENLGQGELGGALLVGRFENGMPVELSHEDTEIAGIPVSDEFVGKLNNFEYSASGACPFHAHIRKTNPREATFDTTKNPHVLMETLEQVKRHAMARRGIIYGHRSKHPNEEEIKEMPKDGVGLLFMSYQSSIEKQFEFIQRKWANSNGFQVPNTGQDLVIGQLEQTRKNGFGKFVKLKGGEYFFAPSMEFLRTINKVVSLKSNLASVTKKR